MARILSLFRGLNSVQSRISQRVSAPRCSLKAVSLKRLHFWDWRVKDTSWYIPRAGVGRSLRLPGSHWRVNLWSLPLHDLLQHSTPSERLSVSHTPSSPPWVPNGHQWVSVAWRWLVGLHWRQIPQQQCRHTTSCSFAQACTSWPLKCDPSSLAIGGGYLHVVPASLIPYGEQPGLHGDRRKLGSGLTLCPHKSSIFRIFTQREGVNIMDLSIPQFLGTPMNGPDSFGRCFGLFRTHRTCCYWIKRVTVVQGQSGILDNTPLHPGTAVATLPLQPICCISWRLTCWGSYLG